MRSTHLRGWTVQLWILPTADREGVQLHGVRALVDSEDINITSNGLCRRLTTCANARVMLCFIGQRNRFGVEHNTAPPYCDRTVRAPELASEPIVQRTQFTLPRFRDFLHSLILT
jgi:hypothetical protein